MVSDFKRLKVWHKSINFAAMVYKMTKYFPNSEKFGLTSQIRRAAVSISGNIAEGCGKSTKKDFARYLYNAYGSVKEVENYLILASKLDIISNMKYDETMPHCEEVSKMLFSLIKSLEKQG